MAGGLVGKVWAEFGGDASKLKKTAGEAVDVLNNVKDAAGGASGGISEAFKGFAISAIGIENALKLVERGIEAVKQVWEFSAEGAQIASLEGASYKLARAYDANMADIVTSLKGASFNTITEIDAMRGANLALTLGISTSADEISSLMQIAMERGRAFGLTTEEAFERITKGIGRRSTKILDDLGFMTDAVRVNKEYADSLGITTAELTDQMKVRALFLDILKQGNAELMKQGGLMMDVSTPYQRLTAMYEDFWNQRKMAAGYTVLPFIATPDEVRSINNQAASVAVLSGKFEDFYNARMRAASAGVAGVGAKAVAMSGAVPSESDFAEMQRRAEYQALYRKRMALEELQITQDEYNEALRLNVGLSGELTKAHEKYEKILSDTELSAVGASKAQGELNRTYNEFFLAMMGQLGMSEGAQIALGVSLGEISKKELIAFDVATKLFDLYSKGVIDIDQLAGAIKNATGQIEELNDIQIESKSASIIVDIIIRGSLSDLKAISKFGGISGGATTSVKPMKHGGVIYGGQHGMIVPPGFSNDGMMVAVSSGEELRVTPAGNKNIEGGGNTMRFYGPVTFQVSKDIRKEDLISQLRL